LINRVPKKEKEKKLHDIPDPPHYEIKSIGKFLGERDSEY
jgi:hypothetical protein